MSSVDDLLAEVKAHALRQKGVRIDVLAALYASRITSLEGLSLERVARVVGQSAAQARFACEVLVGIGLAETILPAPQPPAFEASREALPPALRYRITARGCLEIESITEKE
jgi:hypothetical protein